LRDPDPAETMPDPTPHSDKRVRPRIPLVLRADARLITEQERIDIQAGLGLADLDTEALSLSRPRWDMTPAQTQDLSGAGLRLRFQGLRAVEAGQSLCLDLHLPGHQRVVKLLADVMWSREDDGQPVAGLRFAALEQEGFYRLLDHLGRAPYA
jgi:hypothetical protein